VSIEAILIGKSVSVQDTDSKLFGLKDPDLKLLISDPDPPLLNTKPRDMI